MQANAIKSLKGKIIKNGANVAITAKGIKEYMNMPHSYYFDKNEMVGHLDKMLSTANYIGTYEDTKGRPNIVCIHIWEIHIKGNKNFLLARENQASEIQFYGISESEKVTEKKYLRP